MPTRAAVKVVDAFAGAHEDGRLSQFFKAHWVLAVNGKSVLLHSSFVEKQPENVAISFLSTIDAFARCARDFGATRVSLSTNSISTDYSPWHYSIIRSADTRGMRPLHCQTRYSGRVFFDLPDCYWGYDVVISAPLICSLCLSSFASSNLLGLVRGESLAPPDPFQWNDDTVDLAVDVVSTLNAGFALNFIPAVRIPGKACKIIMGANLPSVDAVTSWDQGFDPDNVALLRNLPAWLGPIGADRIQVDHYTIR